MPRPGTILRLTTVALAAAFVVMVQRDTFVRRWLVPSQPSPTPMLDRNVPEISFDTTSFNEAVTHLAQVSGTRVSSYVSKRPVDEGTQFRRTFHNYSVRRLLWAIIDHWTPHEFSPRVVTARNGGIDLRWWAFEEHDNEIFYRLSGTSGAPGANAQVYDVTDLLRAGNTAATSRVPGTSLMVSRQTAIDALRHHASVAAPRSDALFVSEFGSRFIVTTRSQHHRTVSDMLADLREDAALRAWVFGGIKYDP